MRKGIFKCDCGAHILEVSQDEDLKDLFYFSMWTLYNSYPLTLRGRIRHCLHILRTGRPYEDQIILRKPEVKKLMKLLGKLMETK